jgi:hypothetical protein
MRHERSLRPADQMGPAVLSGDNARVDSVADRDARADVRSLAQLLRLSHGLVVAEQLNVDVRDQ